MEKSRPAAAPASAYIRHDAPGSDNPFVHRCSTGDAGSHDVVRRFSTGDSGSHDVVRRDSIGDAGSHDVDAAAVVADVAEAADGDFDDTADANAESADAALQSSTRGYLTQCGERLEALCRGIAFAFQSASCQQLCLSINGTRTHSR